MACISKIRSHIEKVLGFAPRRMAERQLIQAEQRLGFQIPSCLKQYYLFNGNLAKLNTAHNRLLKPAELYVEDDYLVFYEENQGVARWGIRLPPLDEDPPVFQQWQSRKGLRWTLDMESFSSFMIAMAYWQSVNGALPHSAFGAGKQAKCLKWLRQHGELVHKNSQFRVFRISGVIAVIFAKPNRASAEVFLGAAARSQMRGVQKLIDLAWD